jgi:hypothetical protein
MKIWVLSVFLFVLVIFMILMGNGYRFTPSSAAKSSDGFAKDAELMDEYHLESFDIFLFKSDEEEKYQTVLSEKKGILYKSPATTNIPYTSGNLQTVGYLMYSSKKGTVAMISVISKDEEVAYIEVGVEPKVRRKEVTIGERISFLFSFHAPSELQYLTAYNKEGKRLYFFGYPED